MAARKQNKHFVTQELENAAKTFQERNEKYGNNSYGGAYKQHGHVMTALFPDGLELVEPEDYNRMGVVNMMVSKLVRYANNFDEGGHHDSLHDLSVYAAMLNDLDQGGI